MTEQSDANTSGSSGTAEEISHFQAYTFSVTDRSMGKTGEVHVMAGKVSDLVYTIQGVWNCDVEELYIMTGGKKITLDSNRDLDSYGFTTKGTHPVFW